MRAAFDEAPEDRRRREILQATHYDVGWGSPPAAGEGLVWSDERLLYEPTSDESGAPYRAPSRLHAWPVYVQASWDSDFSRWRTRWVEASTTLPDPARPYRVLSTGETRTADAAVAAERGRIVDLATVKESGYSGFDKPIVIPQHLLRPTPKATYDWTDYVWVSQHQLPVGCPYPAYAHMPVPKADYRSGYWLSPDYSPSMPLPPGYPAWRCGVEGTEGKPHKGGGKADVPMPPPYIETIDPTGTDGGGGFGGIGGLGGLARFSSPSAPGVREEGKSVGRGAQRLRERVLTPAEPPLTPSGSAPVTSPELERIQAELGRVERALADARTQDERRKLEAEKSRLEHDLGREQDWLKSESIRAEKEARGDDGYGKKKVGIPAPTGLIGSPEDDKPQQPDHAPAAPSSAPRRPSAPNLKAELDELRKKLNKWMKLHAAARAAGVEEDRINRDRQAIADAIRSLERKIAIKKQSIDSERNPTEAQIHQFLVITSDLNDEIQARRADLAAVDARLREAQATRLERQKQADLALAELRAALPRNQGRGTPVDTTSPWPLRMNVLLEFGEPALAGGYVKFSGSELERFLNTASVAFTDSLSVGVMLDASSGIGLLLAPKFIEGDSRVDHYGFTGGSMAAINFGAIDYKFEGTMPPLSLQAVTNLGGLPPVHEWFVFEGPVNKEWRYGALATTWGGRKEFGSAASVRVPLVRSKETYRR